MEQSQPFSPLKKLLLGALLRCPNCGRGHIMRGWFTVNPTCPVCSVRFERQPGEGTGAMMIVMSMMPLPAIILFMVLYSVGTIPLGALLGGLLVGMIVVSLLAYRHARGIWVAIIDLSGGLKRDEAQPAKPGEFVA
jgi:uncharacterized protein (DUF983 family)